MCKYLYVGNNTQEYINLCRYFNYSCSHDWQLMPRKNNDIMFFVYVVWLFWQKFLLAMQVE